MKVKLVQIVGDDLVVIKEEEVGDSIIFTAGLLEYSDKYYGFWSIQDDVAIFMMTGNIYKLDQLAKPKESSRLMPSPVKVWNEDSTGVSVVEWSDGQESRIDFRNYTRLPSSQAELFELHQRRRFPELTG